MSLDLFWDRDSIGAEVGEDMKYLVPPPTYSRQSNRSTPLDSEFITSLGTGKLAKDRASS